MPLLDCNVIIKITNRNAKFYKELGYEVKRTKEAQTLVVKNKDVNPTSGSNIYVMCDYCGKIFQTRAIDFYKRNSIKKVACSNCIWFKTSETIQEKYGCKCYTQTAEYKEKTKKTSQQKYGSDYFISSDAWKNKAAQVFLERYGVTSYAKTEECKEKTKNTVRKKFNCDYVSQNEDVKRKQKETLQRKYGVDCYFQASDFKKKSIETSLKRYGTIFPSQSNQIKEKTKQSCLEKYGVTSYTKTAENRERCRTQLQKQGCLQSSKGQELICEIVGGKINSPFHGFFLDVLYEDWLDIEYNGGGHDLQVKLGQTTQEDFNKKEARRSAAILSYGLKQLILINEQDQLLDEAKLTLMLFEAIEELRTTNKNKIEINLAQ